MSPARIGLIVPPGHGQVPSDAALLWGDRFDFIARGLGIEAISPEGFAPVEGRIVELAMQLRDEGAQAISLMGTSLSFHRGAAFTDSLRDQMHKATGLPCTTMSHAIVRALRHLGVQRVAVATSYIDALNERLIAYLQDSGLTASAIEGLSITGVDAVREVSTRALIDLAQRVYERDRSAQGVLISCGGLMTLEAIETLESRLGLPVLASSPSGFWDVVLQAQGDASSWRGGQLFASQSMDNASLHDGCFDCS